MRKLSRELAARKTDEAKIAKDSDLLDQVFLLREYQWAGNKEASDWLKPGEKEGCQQEKQMSTKLAKQIAKQAKKQEPSFWWTNLWTVERKK